MRLLVLFAAGWLGCATVHALRGVPGGSALVGHVASSVGEVKLYRWTPTAAALFATGGPKVVVIPEIGFDHRLVAPLCGKLRDSGFDVVTFDPPRGLRSFDDFVLAAAAAVASRRGRVRLVAVGVGGEAAFDIARAGGASGIVAVDVPVWNEVGDVTLARALADDLFDPRAWAASDRRATLLFGSADGAPERAIARLERETVPVTPALAADLADRLARHAPVELPEVRMRVFVSVADNWVEPEDALEMPHSTWRPRAARRLGRVELFLRDYGHLDWLASSTALDDVTPALVRALEALP